MGYDGLVTGAIARQLQKNLQDGKIEKIYQPEKDEIILHVNKSKEKHRLYISANGSHARMHLTVNDHANPQNPMAFCMLLRKHFQGGRITAIRQVDSERIVEILIDHINEMG
ncbi:MAG: NFACT family protein, partial [Eubacteriales bacterium]|nr:NFACT family protein [Eubacteriales bacterium]